MLSGKIVEINKIDKYVVIELDEDKHFVSLHIDCCKGFKPKIRDLVNVSDSSYDEWFIEKQIINHKILHCERKFDGVKIFKK